MSVFIQKLYFFSPIWCQQFAINIWGKMWYNKRYNDQFLKYVEELRVRNAWNSLQLKEYQRIKLRVLFNAAWNSPYYQNLFIQHKVDIHADPHLSLKCLPYLTKEEFRDNLTDILTSQQIPKGTQIFNTSGSTGTPLKIYYPPGLLALQMAVSEVRNINIGGANYKNRRFMCGGRKVCNFQQSKPPFWRFSPIENLAYGSSYHLSEKYLPYYMDFLNKFKPEIVMGYPSALSTICRYALEHNYDLPQSIMVSTSAETVLPAQREIIEKVWKCKLYDRYGSVEGCIFAGQCEYGNYHVSPDIGHVEILDSEGNPCPPGKIGYVIVTGIHNTLQPLIRYKIGDMAKWSTQQECKCGIQTPILENIEGRIEELCITPDGRQMLRFHSVFYGIAGIKESQIVQEAIDKFTIYVTTNTQYSEKDADKLIKNMLQHVGKVNITIVKVEEIPRTSAGKFKAVICKLSDEEKRSVLIK